MAEKLQLPLDPVDRIVRWANMVGGFYGHPVYLVGSQLTKENPRDVDIAIYLPDDEFCLRYGIKPDKLDSWGLHLGNGVFDATHWAWSDDMVKKSLNGMKYVEMPIDLKVLPRSYAERQYPDCNKVQLDTRISVAKASVYESKAPNGCYCPGCNMS